LKNQTEGPSPIYVRSRSQKADTPEEEFRKVNLRFLMTTNRLIEKALFNEAEGGDVSGNAREEERKKNLNEAAG
jgi:hypothetical protein